MSTVTYTPSAAGSTLQTKTLTSTPAAPTQPTSCANVVTADNLLTSAAALKTTYFPYIQSGNAFLTFKNELATADTPANTGLTATVSTQLLPTFSLFTTIGKSAFLSNLDKIACLVTGSVLFLLLLVQQIQELFNLLLYLNTRESL